MMRKIADYWFPSPGGLCGVIVVEDEFTKERRAYVGVGKGDDYMADREKVLALGAKLSQASLVEILNLLFGREVGKHVIEIDALLCGVLYGLILQANEEARRVLKDVEKQLVAIKLKLEEEAGVNKEILPGGNLRLTDKDGNVVVRPPLPFEIEGN